MNRSAGPRRRQLPRGLRWFATLSWRGRISILVGPVLAVTSYLIGQVILLRLGILLVATPLVCLVVVGRAKFELHATHFIAPARVTAGELARVTVRVYNDATTPSRVLLAEDHLPWTAAQPRFALDRMAPADETEFVYQTRARVRGRYEIGPLTVRLADPFGMCERGTELPGTHHLVVIPVVEPLPLLPMTAQSAGETENRPTNQPTQGDDDIRIREYVQGDPLNRIHWGTTARRGELMVRQEEHPRQSRASLLLDVREGAHRGEGPDSSVEWAVSACATLVAHLVRTGFAVHVITDRSVGVRAGIPDEIPAAPGAEGPLLDALAVLENAPDGPLANVAREFGRPGAGGLFIAIVGELSHEDAEDLARRRPGGATALAFVLRTHTWERHPHGHGHSKKPPAADMSAILGSGGWRTVGVECGDTVAQAWRAVMGGGDGGRGTTAAAPASPAKQTATASAGGSA